MANLNRLNIADNAIGDQGAEFISVSLPNSNIRALKIAKNSIENEGANALTMAVRKSEVTDLDISNNRISDAAKEGFSETIWDLNCRLVKLNIASNLLSPNGLLYILEGLKNINGKIAILDISDNTLTGKIKDLFAILKHPHCKVSDITMKNCVPNFEDFRQLFEFYSHGFVTDLKAQITTDTDNYGKTFAKMISQASSGEITELRFLSFPNNLTGELNVTKESIKLLIETLKSNTCNIDTIELSNITSSDDTAHELSELIKDPSCKITQISLIGAYLNTDELYETAFSINNSPNSRRKITIKGINTNKSRYLDRLSKAANGELQELEFDFDYKEHIAMVFNNMDNKVTKLTISVSDILKATDYLAKLSQKPWFKINQLEVKNPSFFYDSQLSDLAKNILKIQKNTGRNIEIIGLSKDNVEDLKKHGLNLQPWGCNIM